ncbi:glycosyltransferase family 4 protein [Roseofilum casamattae]|uniref:Glycosyltransferase family 4 protein n=1 Tax=Roseofilum casamattae BLCC-M143 TaxID=3022442 RepID=A0ABT7BS61_9CYAN|nr:glycosyltransferase family 4 protein [Roseofilum casamattae]MDJ1182025.1 glycosyltransferase family 4 protein [Roseofilum casamattae BLCC-M143]
MASQLKISILVSDLSQAGAGRWGGAVRTFLLAQALSQLGHQIEIVGFSFGEPPDPSQFAFPTTCVPGMNYPGFLRSAQTLLEFIQGDIIYALRPKPTSFGLALFKRWQQHRPIILDIDDWELSWHGGDKWRYRPGLKQFGRDVLKREGALRQPDHPLYLKWMEDRVHLADAVTVHTRFLQERFGGVYVPNGKDTTLFDPQHYDPERSRQIYGLSDYRVLMFPGAPRPYKGIEDVLLALDRLEQPDLRVVIVGGSPYDDYDRRLKERWGRWLIYIPKLPYEKMPEVVAAAHVVLVPQRNTPAALAQFPLKLTDAMAMSKPVLASNVGDLPEILGDTGYLVDPESPEQICDRLQDIFQDFDRANRQGQQGRERCHANYSISSMSNILASLLANFV